MKEKAFVIWGALWFVSTLVYVTTGWEWWVTVDDSIGRGIGLTIYHLTGSAAFARFMWPQGARWLE